MANNCNGCPLSGGMKNHASSRPVVLQEIEYLRVDSEGQQAATRAAHLRATEAEDAVCAIMESLRSLTGLLQGDGTCNKGEAHEGLKPEAGDLINQLTDLIREMQEGLIAAKADVEDAKLREGQLDIDLNEMKVQLAERSSVLESLQQVQRKTRRPWLILHF